MHYTHDNKPRQGFIMLVKFPPGQGPKDLVKFFDEVVDERLKHVCGKHGIKVDATKEKVRHSLDIHERYSYITWGRYDMVIIWDAPDMETANVFLEAWMDNDHGSGFTDPENLVIARRGDY